MRLHALTSPSQSRAPSSKRKWHVSAPSCGDSTRMSSPPIRGLGFEEAHICLVEVKRISPETANQAAHHAPMQTGHVFCILWPGCCFFMTFPYQFIYSFRYFQVREMYWLWYVFINFILKQGVKPNVCWATRCYALRDCFTWLSCVFLNYLFLIKALV